MMVVRKKRSPFPKIVSFLSVAWCMVYYFSALQDLTINNSSSSLKRKKPTPRFDNVLLLGHFNYETNATLVQHWVQRWSEMFMHIHVRGPFTNLNELQEMGITAFYIAPDRGFVSPMKTFGDSLLLAANDSSIVGVLYSHDDMFINMTNLIHRGFPWNNTAMTQMPLTYYETAAMCVYPTGDAILPREGKPRRPYRTHINNTDDKVFAGWRWWKEDILPGMKTLIQDRPNVARYLNQHGGFDLFGGAVSDFGYMPTQYAADFSHMANLFYKHGIFLEIGMPTIFATLTKMHGAGRRHHLTPMFAEYCTTLLQNEREDRHAPLTWIPKCMMASDGDQPLGRKTYHPKKEIATAPFSLYHPIKMSQSVDLWDVLFDAIVWNRPQEALRLANETSNKNNESKNSAR